MYQRFQVRYLCSMDEDVKATLGIPIEYDDGSILMDNETGDYWCDWGGTRRPNL